MRVKKILQNVKSYQKWGGRGGWRDDCNLSI
jgi:hypothetical protein